MKPVFLVRHGQSEGNVNKEIHRERPDYAIRLTQKGIEDAKSAGHELASKMSPGRYILFTSHYFRAKQTSHYIREVLSDNKIFIHQIESPLLREQEWCGGDINGFDEGQESAREKQGVFDYRFRGGESVGDCYTRAALFELDLLDALKSDEVDGVICVGHGMQNRVLVARLTSLRLEGLLNMKNPDNGGVIEMAYISQHNRVGLISHIPTREEENICEFSYSAYDIV